MGNIKTLGLTGLAALVFALAGCGTQGSTGRNPIVNQDGNDSQIKDSGYKTDAEQDTPDGRNEIRDGSANDYDASIPRTDGNDTRDAQVIEEQDASDSCVEYCEIKDGGNSSDASDLDAGELDSGFDSGYRIDGGNERDGGSSRTDGGYTLPEITAGPDMELEVDTDYCLNFGCSPQLVRGTCGDTPFAPGHSEEGFDYQARDRLTNMKVLLDYNNYPTWGTRNRACALVNYELSAGYTAGNNLIIKFEGTNENSEIVSDTTSISLKRKD